MIKLEKTRLSDGGIHVLLQGLIDDIPIRMVLDTGASHSVLDINWAMQNLSTEELEAIEDPAHGIGAALNVHKLAVSKIDIDTLEIRNFTIALIDFSGINSVYEKEGFEEVQGILGGDILYKYEALINYKELVISFNTTSKQAIQ
jgi:hypothetical protein